MLCLTVQIPDIERNVSCLTKNKRRNEIYTNRFRPLTNADGAFARVCARYDGIKMYFCGYIKIMIQIILEHLFTLNH